ALDLREREFGVESLDVAEVLESFPPDDGGDPVGALVRTVRLVSIYESAGAGRADLAWRLLHAYEAEARRPDGRGDGERAERALVDALALADGHEGDERAEMQGEALHELASFYLGHDRTDAARALFAGRAAPAVAAPDGEGVELAAFDRCWLD